MTINTRFWPGQIVATPGALKALHRAGESPVPFLMRHLSSYKLTDGTEIWIITEADRSATTLLLPFEY